MEELRQKSWLVLSYLANRDGSACSQHIDDKLSPLIERGIQPVLLTSPGWTKHTGFPHKTALSIAPSGLRYELRSFLRLHCKTKLTFKLFETPLLIPILPFYLLEKIILDLESEWSWYIRASQIGIGLCNKYQPEIIYSTGGPACAHLAASKIAKKTGIPWIAELQDPIIHDAEYHRSNRAFKYYSRLEKLIRQESSATLYMCDAARHNADRRTGISNNSYTVYPGASQTLPVSTNPDTKNTKKCVFSHFGSLGGTRDATVLISALKTCLEQDSSLINKIQLEFFGTCDSATAKAIASFPYPDTVLFHGKIPRSLAIQKMYSSTCLILIQNREFFSSETIPSKLYEYMLTGKPILALTFQNPEIDVILNASNHFPVEADNQQAISKAIFKIITLHRNGTLFTANQKSPWTAERAVDQLLSIAKTCLETTEKSE